MPRVVDDDEVEAPSAAPAVTIVVPAYNRATAKVRTARSSLVSRRDPGDNPAPGAATTDAVQGHGLGRLRLGVPGFAR
jgi:hypothetical protein